MSISHVKLINSIFLHVMFFFIHFEALSNSKIDFEKRTLFSKKY